MDRIKIAILGFAREGHSILKFLKNDKRFKKAEIWILDKNPKAVSGIRCQVSGVRTGKNYLKKLDTFDVVFRSPGIPYLLPEIQKAKKAGVKISSATNLFFERCPGTIIGITGTKGKGTTSTLLYKILKAAGKKVFLAGNVGKSALDILPKTDKKSIVVFELSSFQLQDIQKSPAVAAVLEVFPDHLDAHKNVNEYYEAKTNIGRYQKAGDKIFFFKNSALSRKVANKGKGKKIGINPSTSLPSRAGRTGEKSFKLFLPDDLLIKGMHNFKNAVMAAKIAESLGVPEKIILSAICEFNGMEHRLELARKITKNGSEVYFYNDSASTNPQTAAAAIKAFPNENKILIAGGQDKNLDYKPLANALKNSGTKLVILFGENKRKIYAAIKNSGVPIKLTKNLGEAVNTAYRQAIFYILHSTFCNIIFSPAATSFDMFKNYADRGEKFKKIVKGLK